MIAASHDNLGSVFQACLEMIQSGQETFDSALSRYPEQAGAIRPALEAFFWLQGRGRYFDPRPGFVELSRNRLVARIRNEVSSRPFLVKIWADLLAWFSRPKRFALQFVLVLVLVTGLAIGTSGVAVASRNSIPGDTLYPTKIWVENARLALTPGDVGDARLFIEFSQRRLSEVQALILKGKYHYISETATEFNRQVNQATQLLKIAAEKNDPRVAALVALLKNKLVNQSRMLAALSGIIPDEVKEDFVRLNSLVGDGIASTDEIINTVPLPPTSTTTPTPTSEGTHVATAFPGLAPTYSLRPSLTSTVLPSPVGTPTAKAVNASPTVTPSAEPLKERATLTPTPTSTKTVRPSRTPKSTKRPTRTPRPSKTPKSENEAPAGTGTLAGLEPW